MKQEQGPRKKDGAGERGKEGQGRLNPTLGRTEWNRGALIKAPAEEPGGGEGI